jgi:hypothetical protein
MVQQLLMPLTSLESASVRVTKSKLPDMIQSGSVFISELTMNYFTAQPRAVGSHMEIQQ